MTDRALRRTVRRGTALLLLPLLVVVIQFDVHLRKRAGLVDSSIVNISESLAYVAVLGVLVYLVASGVRQLYAELQ